MAIENLIGKLFLVGMTIAHGLNLFGVNPVKRPDVTAHGNLMMGAFGLVGLWLVADVNKQWLVGRAQCVGTVEPYWSL